MEEEQWIGKEKINLVKKKNRQEKVEEKKGKKNNRPKAEGDCSKEKEDFRTINRRMEIQAQSEKNEGRIRGGKREHMYLHASSAFHESCRLVS